MNYLIKSGVNTHHIIDPMGDEFNSHKKRKGLSCLLMISLILLMLIPKQSMASNLGDFLFKPALFCKSECSQFISVPSSLGVGVGLLAGGATGAALGVPVAMGLGAISLIKGDVSTNLFHDVSSITLFSSIIAAVAGSQVMSNVVAVPFWGIEQIVYEAPINFYKLTTGQ